MLCCLVTCKSGNLSYISFCILLTEICGSNLSLILSDPTSTGMGDITYQIPVLSNIYQDKEKNLSRWQHRDMYSSRNFHVGNY